MESNRANPVCLWRWSLHSCMVLLVGYVYGDAKRRGMPYVMWTLLAIFIPDGFGIILYFILRKAMPKACPVARGMFRQDLFSARIAARSLQATCPNCGRGVERGGRTARLRHGNCRPQGFRQTALPHCDNRATFANLQGAFSFERVFPVQCRRNSEEFCAIRASNLVAGRTPEQKRKLAERITQVLIEDGNAKRENIQVTFVDCRRRITPRLG